jgi:hypothetical protein
VFILSCWFHNRWWSSGTHLACFLDHRRQANCSGGLLPFGLVIFITYTITFKNLLYYQELKFMMLIHLIIILINSLSMLIIIVEHLFVWFIHVLGGGKATLLLLQHAMCIASFILHWKLCRVPKVMTVPVQHLEWSSIPCWVCRQKTCCICIHMHLMYCWKRCVIVVSIGSLFIIYCSILGLILKCGSMLNRCLIELVV